jgi:hypothetical protein
VVPHIVNTDLFGVWLTADCWIEIAVQKPVRFHDLTIPVSGIDKEKFLPPLNQSIRTVHERGLVAVRLCYDVEFIGEVPLPNPVFPRD